jgi:hypothetical protein
MELYCGPASTVTLNELTGPKAADISELPAVHIRGASIQWVNSVRNLLATSTQHGLASIGSKICMQRKLKVRLCMFGHCRGATL